MRPHFKSWHWSTPSELRYVHRRQTANFMQFGLNPLPNVKLLDWSEFKAHADDKTNVTQNLNFLLERVENILGKGENAGYQHFLLFPKCFQKASFSRVVKSRDSGKKLIYNFHV